MRSASRALLTAGAACILAATPSAAAIAAAPPAKTGITVAPAALQLGLHKDEQRTDTTFELTNNYQAPVTLGFTIEAPTDQQPGVTDVRSSVTVNQPIITIDGGKKATQTITLTDNARIHPGSQQVDLVISQQGASGSGVGVLPSLRLPVTVIKYDGAITSLALTGINRPRLAMDMPKTVTITLHNTGNMTAIPRGTVTLLSPNGTAIGKGTLNEPSRAIAPGASLAFTTTITPIDNSLLPGGYRIVANYSLGGATASQTGSVSFWYVAAWHLLVGIASAAASWAAYRFVRQLWPRRAAKRRHSPRRPSLAGRNIR